MLTEEERELLFLLASHALIAARYNNIGTSELHAAIAATRSPKRPMQLAESDAELHCRINAGLRLENASLKARVDILEKKIEAKDSEVATISKDNDTRMGTIERLARRNELLESERRATFIKVQRAIDKLAEVSQNP